MPLADPTVRRQELGEELRALREASGWSLTTAGQRIDASASKVCRIESGQVTASPEDVAALLAVYGVTGPQRRELLELAREAEKRGWWQRHLLDYQTCRNTLFHQEAKASTIVNFELALIPGMLQTRAYTRSLMHDGGHLSEDEVEYRVSVRQERQGLLVAPNPPDFLGLVDELALRRPLGGQEVFQHQLVHLLRATEHPNITLRVIPNDGRSHPGLGGGFLLLRKDGCASVACTDDLVSSHYFEERIEVDEYASAIQRLSDRSYDQQQSRELIATLANADDQVGSSWIEFGGAAATAVSSTSASRSPATPAPRRSETPKTPTDLT